MAKTRIEEEERRKNKKKKNKVKKKKNKKRKEEKTAKDGMRGTRDGATEQERLCFVLSSCLVYFFFPSLPYSSLFPLSLSLSLSLVL